MNAELSTEIIDVEVNEVEQQPTVLNREAVAAMLRALPPMRVEGHSDNGVQAYFDGKKHDSNSEKNLDLNKLVTFITKPFVHYEIKMLDDGKPFPKVNADLTAKEASPYFSFVLDGYKKPDQININAVPDTQKVQHPQANMTFVQRALLAGKESNIRVSTIYLGVAFYELKMYFVTVKNGRFALWSALDNYGPEKPYKRLCDLGNALQRTPAPYFDPVLMKLVQQSGGNVLPVMWDEFALRDTKAPTNRSKRGVHLAPVEPSPDNAKQFPYVNPKGMFETNPVASFEGLMGSVSGLLEADSFRDELFKLYLSGNNVGPFVKNRFADKEADVVEPTPKREQEVSAEPVDEMFTDSTDI